MPSQAEGWRYAEGAFEDEPPLALIGIEAAIVLGIPLAWGLAWKPYRWAKDNLRNWVAAGGRTASPPAFDDSREAHVATQRSHQRRSEPRPMNSDRPAARGARRRSVCSDVGGESSD